MDECSLRSEFRVRCQRIGGSSRFDREGSQGGFDVIFVKVDANDNETVVSVRARPVLQADRPMNDALDDLHAGDLSGIREP
jgi:hypothetical protein